MAHHFPALLLTSQGPLRRVVVSRCPLGQTPFLAATELRRRSALPPSADPHLPHACRSNGAPRANKGTRAGQPLSGSRRVRTPRVTAGTRDRSAVLVSSR